MPKETKAVLLQKGTELIFQKGYNNTGIQEILNAAGVPKGSFYHFFKSKEDFALQVLEGYGQQIREWMTSIFERDDLSPLTRLQVFFTEGRDKFACSKNQRGCLVGNMTQEMGSLSPTFERCLDEKWRNVRRRLTQCLREAKACGELLNEEDPELLADFLVNGWQGSIMRLKLSRDPVTLDNFIKVVFGSLLRPAETAAA